ncbi:hypothetical protein C8R46DRAFT_1235055 [Mycena filopes]|nr:hypothetical protein C8R46DRAFT_1235055 [Mycena filopes]
MSSRTHLIHIIPSVGKFPASVDAPRATRAKRKAKEPSPESESGGEDPKAFEILIHIPAAEKKSGSRKQVKSKAKVEPLKFGPVAANVNISYEELMAVLAEALDTEAMFLATSSAEWRWMKPANSQFVPLCNEAGLRSLTRQILAPPKGASGAYIIVKMNPPVKRPVPNQPAWSDELGASTAFPELYPDTAEDDESDGDARKLKKVPFDEGLEDEMDRITERYPPGICSVHPTISCFHHRLNNLHFELDRSRKIVWAAAMKKGTTSLIAAPMGSKLFQAAQALKNPSAPLIGTQPAAVPATPVAHQPPVQYLYWLSPYGAPFQPPAYPSFPPMPYPNALPGYQSPRMYGTPLHDHRRRRQRSWDGGSSPPAQSTSKRRQIDPLSSPALSGGSIVDFLSLNPQFPPGLNALLQQLGFELGDDITIISEAQWTSADIPQFTAARIVKSYNKYKASLRSL